MYTFPELSQLTISEPVKQALINHLLEPFQSEAKLTGNQAAHALSLVSYQLIRPLNTLIPYLKILARLLKLNLRLYVS